jgi:hypothetical protein
MFAELDCDTSVEALAGKKPIPSEATQNNAVIEMALGNERFNLGYFLLQFKIMLHLYIIANGNP